MPRSFWVAGLACLGFAFILSFFASISLPVLTGLDIVRVQFGGRAQPATLGLYETRFGVWSRCDYFTDGSKNCTAASGSGYTTEVRNPLKSLSVTVGQSWTRGLPVHAVASGVTLIAFLLAFPNTATMALFTLLTSALAAILLLIAFIIDIPLRVFVGRQMEKLQAPVKTFFGRAFWLSFTSFLLVVIAAVAIYIGRRRDLLKDGTSSYPMRRGFGFGKS